MRIVPRESIPEKSIVVQASERLVQVELAVDLTSRAKVNRVVEIDGQSALAKPRGRFAIVSQSSSSPPAPGRPPH
jgi:hypothetical protein